MCGVEARGQAFTRALPRSAARPLPSPAGAIPLAPPPWRRTLHAGAPVLPLRSAICPVLSRTAVASVVFEGSNTVRTDLAALIPPLVMAAAFIAGVIALLRSEIAPRRRRRRGDSQLPSATGSEMKHGQIPSGRQNGDGEDGSADNSAN